MMVKSEKKIILNINSKKMINKFIIIILIMQFISCSEKNDKKQESSQYDYQSELKRKIISNGDKKAYDSLSFVYMKDTNITDVLTYSIIIMNDYNYTIVF